MYEKQIKSLSKIHKALTYIDIAITISIIVLKIKQNRIK